MAENDCQGEDPLALPEDMRLPLHSLQADARYLAGRTAQDPDFASAMADTVLERLSQIETATYRLLAEILSLSQERDRLREALAPFADIPPVTLSELDRRPLYAAHYWCVIGSPDKTHFTREDLARARAALNKEPPCQET